MSGYLNFVTTSGSMCCVVNQYESESVISSNYKGECLVFSSEIMVSGLTSSPLKLKKMRVTLTPGQFGAYVECGITELNEVYLVKLQLQTAEVSSFSLRFSGDAEIILKKEISVFDDLDERKELELWYTQLDNRGTDIWRAAIGKKGQPFDDKNQIFQGDWRDIELKCMYIFYDTESLTFSCFCDEFVANLQANGDLRLDLLVQKKKVQAFTLKPRIDGSVYKWKYNVFVFEELDTDTDTDTGKDTDESTSGEDSDILDISDLSFIGSPGGQETTFVRTFGTPARASFPSPMSPMSPSFLTIGGSQDAWENSSGDESARVLPATPSTFDPMSPPRLVRQSALRGAGRRVRDIDLRFANEDEVIDSRFPIDGQLIFPDSDED